MIPVERSTWEAIKHLPAKYDTGGAEFMPRKTPQAWFAAFDPLAGAIACASVFPVSKTTARLSNLFVREEWRGKGIGSRLIDAREAWAREMGFTRMDTITMQLMHRRRGYVVKKVYKCGKLHHLEREL